MTNLFGNCSKNFANEELFAEHWFSAQFSAVENSSMEPGTFQSSAVFAVLRSVSRLTSGVQAPLLYIHENTTLTLPNEWWEPTLLSCSPGLLLHPPATHSLSPRSRQPSNISGAKSLNLDYEVCTKPWGPHSQVQRFRKREIFVYLAATIWLFYLDWIISD